MYVHAVRFSSQGYCFQHQIKTENNIQYKCKLGFILRGCFVDLKNPLEPEMDSLEFFNWGSVERLQAVGALHAVYNSYDFIYAALPQKLEFAARFDVRQTQQ